MTDVPSPVELASSLILIGIVLLVVVASVGGEK